MEDVPDKDKRFLRSSLGVLKECCRTVQKSEVLRIVPGVKVVFRVVRLQVHVFTNNEQYRKEVTDIYCPWLAKVTEASLIRSKSPSYGSVSYS